MMFCAANDVTKEIGSTVGSAWDSNDIDQAIQDATEEIKARLLAGAVSEADVQDWIKNDSPVLLKNICAKRAGALLLRRHSMKSELARDLAKEAERDLSRLLKDKSTVLFNSDNEAIATADQAIRTSTDGCTPKLSIGDSGLGTTGTLDAMDD